MATPSLVIVPDRYKAGKLYSQIPVDGTGDFTVVRGTTATRVNASGLIESVASGVPRLDYTGGGCPALLVEPAATNQIRNNTMVGAVTGTPGTLPTNYSTIDRGLTRQVVGTGVENGIEYIDLRFSGTADSSAPVRIDLETSTGIAALTGQNWSLSLYFAIISGTPNDVQLSRFERTSGGVVVAGTAASLTITPNATLLRYTQSALTTGGATTAFVSPHLNIGVTSGSTYDFTIRIGLPQMELGAVATSVIKTSTVAVTRNADVISLSSVSGLIGQTQGTLYAEVDLRSIANRRILSLNDGTGSNEMRIGIDSSNFLQFAVIVGGVVQVNIFTTYVAGIYKIAAAYSENNFAMYVNGALIATDTLGTVPATSQINLGSSFSGGSQLNDRISAAAIYTSRLSNSELAQLTQL